MSILAMKIKINTLFTIGIILLCLSFIGCKEMNEELKAKRLIEECRTLRIGMTKEQVLEIMGRPLNIVEIESGNGNKERLFFLSPKLASESTQCTIDKEKGLAEEIICGENYRLTK